MINTCQFVLCWVAHGHESPPQPEEGPFGARLNLGTVTQISETKMPMEKAQRFLARRWLFAVETEVRDRRDVE